MQITEGLRFDPRILWLQVVALRPAEVPPLISLFR